MPILFVEGMNETKNVLTLDLEILKIPYRQMFSP